MSEELPPLPGRLAPGSQLAGYRTEEEIGRGGMAVVYRAHDDHVDRRVALKVLAPDLARDEVFRARFIQESRIAAATEHPNIIPVFSAGEADGVLYIAMRYAPDGDVRTLIDRVGPLPAARACARAALRAAALAERARARPPGRRRPGDRQGTGQVAGRQVRPVSRFRRGAARRLRARGDRRRGGPGRNPVLTDAGRHADDARDRRGRGRRPRPGAATIRCPRLPGGRCGLPSRGRRLPG